MEQGDSEPATGRHPLGNSSVTPVSPQRECGVTFAAVQYGILGPLTVSRDGREVRLGGARQRSMLAVLLLHANELVPTARIVDELWGERPPATAVKAVQVQVSQLRKLLEEGALETRPTGYLLRVEPGALDLQRFESLLDQGRERLAQGEAREAAGLLRDALGFWRGAPLAEFEYEAFARNEIGRLEELRLAALELRLEADLALGRQTELVGELEGLVRDHPLRESLARLLILALYRAGRQADALAVMHDTRARLRDELGLDPSQALQQLEKQILLQDPTLDPALAVVVSPTAPSPAPIARPRPATPAPVCANCGTVSAHGAEFCNACGAALATTAPWREVRKTVTVLFCDVVGSTALGEQTDPEALRALLARYFERMSAIVESHGGTVEKFIGDAVMAVFGVPAAHEDDALRAIRASVEMRDALPELGVRGRIGVNTGEVVTGTSERLATGDAVNVAARFQQAAAPDEVLIGAATHAFVHEAVMAEPVEPLTLAGKSQPVPAYRLLSVLGAPERSHASTFVGRERELAQIREAWKSAERDARCELLTVVGEAGVGKSRLETEALGAVEARAVRGRCLSYGEGITYWPVVEVVKQLAVLPSDPAAAAAMRSLLGESGLATSGDEIAWAFRKLLEEQAPLVVVFDDIQWGEETFLDLVDSMAMLSDGAPILLLCLARPELLDRRPGWPAALRLEPLPAEEADALIGDQVSGELRERIARAAGGNPLFISEMLAMAADDAEVEVPPTLKALLAARLDQLDEAERKVLERGAVEGEIFHRGGVQALTPEEAQVSTRLAGLVRRELIRPDRAQLAGDDAYRFRHLLIRDAAYDSLPKAIRADLHARFADWLDQHDEELVERDEILGYHLEQATRYLAELGRPDPALSERAAARLAAAGRRAKDRLDDPAAFALLTRAVVLLRPFRLDLALELEAAWANASVDGRAAALAADAVAERAEAAGDRSGAMLGRAMAILWRTYSGERSAPDKQEELCRAALPVEEERGDPRRLALLWELLGTAAQNRMRNDDCVDALERALRYRRLAGDFPTDEGIDWSLILGSRAADEGLRMLDELADDRPPGAADLGRAVLLAMLGRIDEAWPLAEARSNHLRDIGGGSYVGLEYLSLIAMIEGDRERACRYHADLIEALPPGSEGMAASYRLIFARDLCYLGRFDEAEDLLRQAQAVPSRAFDRLLGAAVEALLLAARGELAQAELLARSGVAATETTDNLILQAWNYEDLATVLERAGRIDDAREAVECALAIWERKRCLPYVDRAREQIDSLGQATV
jgi:class 3 adenylate cyclase/DNA-binding SARP family transcriptional activator